MDLEKLSNVQLHAEEQRLLLATFDVIEQSQAVAKQSLIVRSEHGPDAHQKILENHDMYMDLHEQHMLIHAEFMRVHEERMRRM